MSILNKIKLWFQPCMRQEMGYKIRRAEIAVARDSAIEKEYVEKKNTRISPHH